jgi:hypothetical protein
LVLTLSKVPVYRLQILRTFSYAVLPNPSRNTDRQVSKLQKNFPRHLNSANLKIYPQKYKDGSLSHASTPSFGHALNKLEAFLYLDDNSMLTILKGESSRSLFSHFGIYNVIKRTYKICNKLS